MVYLRGNVYWYEFRVFGRRYRGSTKRRNKQAALSVESVTRIKLLNAAQGVPNPVSIPTVSEFSDTFLTNVKVNLSKSTHTLHKVNVDSVKKYFKGRLLTEVSPGDVEQFKMWRAGQDRKNGEGKVTSATVNRCLTTLKKMYHFADVMYPGIRNPVKHVKFLPEPSGRIRALTLEEVEKYLSHAKGDLKDFAILATETGGRPMELLALHAKDVHFEERFVGLPGTKTRKAKRDIPLTRDALEVLQRRIAKSKTGYIFPARRPKTKNRDVMHESCLRKGHDAIVEKHFKDAPFVLYDLRHTFATRCVQAGCELSVLKELMGHTSILTTARYIHPARQQKIDAMSKLENYVQLSREAAEIDYEEDGEALYGEIVTEFADGTKFIERDPHFPPQQAKGSEMEVSASRSR
jgi:integrase